MQQVVDTYNTIAEEISLVLDRDIQLSTSSTGDKFALKFSQGQFDIALVDVGHYLLYGPSVGYTPIARREELLTFQIVTLPSKELEDIQDLKGKRFGCLPNHDATFMISEAMLKDQGISMERDIRNLMYSSQQACVHAMISKLVDACALASPITNFFEQKLNLKLHVLAESEKLPSVAYLAHPRLGKAAISDLRDYFLGREGFVEAKSSDYDIYRKKLHFPIDGNLSK